MGPIGMSGKRQVLARYGLGVASFGLTLLISLIFKHYSISVNLTLLVLAALIGSAWYGGRGPGFMVVGLFMLLTINLTTARAQPFKYAFAEFNVLALLGVLVWLVSSRMKAESRLREQSEWLSVTLSSIVDGVIATDLNGRVSLMNPAAEAMTGWTIAQATGKPLRDVFTTESTKIQETADNQVSQTTSKGQIAANSDYTYLTSRDGINRPIELSEAPIRERTGQLTGTVLVFRDITERKRSEE